MITIAGGVILGFFGIVGIILFWPMIWRLVALAALIAFTAWLVFGGARSIADAIIPQYLNDLGRGPYAVYFFVPLGIACLSLTYWLSGPRPGRPPD